jgi:hypothetical protein
MGCAIPQAGSKDKREGRACFKRTHPWETKKKGTKKRERKWEKNRGIEGARRALDGQQGDEEF